jgi:ribonucleoside-diphosphate reductase alpha chain
VILVDLDNSINKNIKKTSSPKRPKELDGEVHHFVIDRRRYYVVVGLMDNDPYEMFAGVNHGDDAEVYIPKEVKEGKIIKLSRGKYLLKTEETEYDLTNGHSDDNVDALNRMISTSLRHGVDISFVVHQIEKTKGPMISFTKALSRTLKKYIPDGTIVHGDECPNCKSTLTRESGCISCKHCGWSKCS